MSVPKTLILDIGKNPHVLQDGTGGGGDIDEKLKNYVKIADIVNDLITEDPAKPLSAEQGAELKNQIDVLRADVAKIIVQGLGIAGGCGIKVTVEENLSVIQIDIDENSPLAFNENNQLYLEWNENK